MLKRFLYVVLVCVIILAVTWGVTILLGVLPLPFTEVLITLAWIVAGVACLWIVGRFLIDVIPSSAP